MGLVSVHVMIIIVSDACIIAINNVNTRPNRLILTHTERLPDTVDHGGCNEKRFESFTSTK